MCPILNNTNVLNYGSLGHRGASSMCLMWYGSLRSLRVCNCVCLMWYGSLRTQHVEVYFHEPFENVSVCLMRYGSLRTLRECDCVCLSLVELFTCYSGKRSLRTPCVTSVISPVHSQLFSHLLTSIYWLRTGPTMLWIQQTKICFASPTPSDFSHAHGKRSLRTPWLWASSSESTTCYCFISVRYTRSSEPNHVSVGHHLNLRRYRYTRVCCVRYICDFCAPLHCM
jgi:hypothetical protein